MSEAASEAEVERLAETAGGMMAETALMRRGTIGRLLLPEADLASVAEAGLDTLEIEEEEDSGEEDGEIVDGKKL